MFKTMVSAEEQMDVLIKELKNISIDSSRQKRLNKIFQNIYMKKDFIRSIVEQNKYTLELNEKEELFKDIMTRYLKYVADESNHRTYLKPISDEEFSWYQSFPIYQSLCPYCLYPVRLYKNRIKCFSFGCIDMDCSGLTFNNDFTVNKLMQQLKEFIDVHGICGSFPEVLVCNPQKAYFICSKCLQ